jgi:hypothetical protein
MEIIAIKEFVEFFKSKVDPSDLEDIDIDDEMEIFLSSKNYEEVESDDKKGKKKREPTFYILFMKNNKVDKTSGKGEYMKNVANMWKNSEKGKFFSERCVEMKKENSDMSNEVIYDSVDQEWVELENNKMSKKKSIKKKIVIEKKEKENDENDSDSFSQLGEI